MPSKRKTSVSTSKGHSKSSWTCKTCEMVSSDDKAEMMECEVCAGHFCITCIGFSKEEYTFLTKRKDMHWYCPPCEGKAMKNIRVEQEIEERCKAYFEKYEERIAKLEESVAKKPDREEIQELIASKTDVEKVKEIVDEKLKGATGGENIEKTASSDKLDEFKDSMARRNNVIVFKAKELNDKDLEKRRAEDNEIVSELCKITGTEKNSVKNINRVGKRSEDPAKPRPMRIVFDGEASKSHFMSNLRNLAQADERFKCMSIVHDMTKKERKDAYEMHKRAEELNNEDSGEYKYLLRGHPRDRRLVKVRKKTQ